MSKIIFFLSNFIYGLISILIIAFFAKVVGWYGYYTLFITCPLMFGWGYSYQKVIYYLKGR
jgi:hypothetical protein